MATSWGDLRGTRGRPEASLTRTSIPRGVCRPNTQLIHLRHLTRYKQLLWVPMHKPAVHARSGVRRWAGSPTARPSLPDGSGMNPVRSLVVTTRVGCRWMELGNGGIGSCNVDQKQKKGESRVGEAWSRSREHDKSPTPHLLWHLSRYLTAKNPRRRRPFTPPSAA